MKKYKLTSSEVINHFGSDEGCTIYKASKNRFLIFYNDLTDYYKSIERRRWTLAHELGHILLHHHILTNKTIIFRCSLSDDEYKWMEAEANNFASQLLANPSILDKLKIKSKNDISLICQLSDEASEYRFQGYLNWCNHKYKNPQDIIILSQFSDFINKKKCNVCGHGFVSKNSKFCPICGHSLKWGDGKMIYQGINVDINGKAIICPQCSNEQTRNGTEYCSICGISLINKCTNLTGIQVGFDEWLVPCGKIASGNARFCEHCGQPTTYNVQGSLSAWQEEMAIWEIESAQLEVASSPSENLVRIDSDDIPF
ncbi:ImmA/IrrE family metallo-endopeptidase [Clostridium tagluense]|uniref:ImmA/IrrE family metallo-endopeptidase n=1 Tax=Clostridium tagluense TaxID=360422 RepID=UPI001CF176D3|nr:ImmA/IrrE family metallo-endopeptidase [Clostridium tagluense]MCB2297752.1 ImmA/IrrE family metallo-endopeptidase [Clostridium tagluense]